jgi:hypothetical protein
VAAKAVLDAWAEGIPDSLSAGPPTHSASHARAPFGRLNSGISAVINLFINSAERPAAKEPAPIIKYINL